MKTTLILLASLLFGCSKEPQLNRRFVVAGVGNIASDGSQLYVNCFVDTTAAGFTSWNFTNSSNFIITNNDMNNFVILNVFEIKP